ncbi:glycosyltransferase [Polynucleobacter sp. MWH-HuK1]|uniref:glycosyltransferase family protein n=1 Tax=Polynucleobacter sp. MWH-HuK1 TaxID=1743158 RepID=UPI001C0E64DD|nr:glycosyltransferase [Polynucleobacter sp. MWH-HuK1]MBU3564451.1 glycosyltransferase family 1 protein [Polynucleobacter sp. MWH-HuK1]
MKIIYSFGKVGFEADYWEREIAAASTAEYTFIPFNHAGYEKSSLFMRAQLLDNLYFENSAGLARLYANIEEKIRTEQADALMVDTYNPYHPDYLRKLGIYKVLRINDGPMAAYDRDFAYLHAFDHVLYHSPAYSKDMQIDEKLRYCRAKRIDFWPLGSFDALCDRSMTEEDIKSKDRDIDIAFVGALAPNKMPLIAAVKKAFGRRMKLYGLTNLKRNAYFNLKFGFPGWVKPLQFEQYVSLYQRTKIGINVHNRGDYTVGGYRLFDLPANGVMQISDGGPYLETFFEIGSEIESYRNADELIDKIKYYLTHDTEREQIALNGYRRLNRDYLMAHLLQKAGALIKIGMENDFKSTNNFRKAS